MTPQGIKVDLHVHSKMSNRPSQWILQKLNCPESFTSPIKVHRVAKQRGMDLVTITDHNTINGSLEIAHLPDTFISEEVTTYFPENKCKLHLLTLDINEHQHQEISKLRQNVYDLSAYLNSEDITHVLAHPLFDINHKMTIVHFEKMLLLFKNFELNGSRDHYQNRVLLSVLKGICEKDIALLADKHNMEPRGNQPWVKNITGGSDDHSSLNIARMYTYVPGATDMTKFFQGLESGRSAARGEPATPQTLAHNLYGIAYQYYKSTFNLAPWVHKDVLFRFVDRALTVPDETTERGILTRLQDFFISRRPDVSFLKGREPGIIDMIQNKGKDFLAKNENFRKVMRNPRLEVREKEKIWFQFANEVSDQIMRNLADNILNSFSRARLLNIFQTIGSAGSVYSMMAPYFMGYRLFTRDRQFAEHCHLRFLGAGPAFKPANPKVAIFTDTFQETNGVALTIRMQLEAARKNYKNLSVLTCYPLASGNGEINFEPIGFYDIPEYPELKLYYPPFLKMLEYCFQNEITHIHASTPGPVGLAAVGVARTLGLPLYGTYHTAFPQYAEELTGDGDLSELMWKLMIWFYNQMDLVYVPSRATGKELAERGLEKSRIRYYSRGIDINRFHPDRKNRLWTSGYGLENNSIKLLYVGRISKEKNLEVLARAFERIFSSGRNIDLIVVGDGPYKQQMQNRLKNNRVLFTGKLTGDRLAQAYASSDLFVFPSATDTFGNVVLEAQASGIPVIVTDQGGPKENMIPGKTGILVPAFDHEAIADAVISLYENPDRIKDMKNHARRYMHDLAFEDHFLAYWQQYESHEAEPPTGNSGKNIFSMVS